MLDGHLSSLANPPNIELATKPSKPSCRRGLCRHYDHLGRKLGCFRAGLNKIGVEEARGRQDLPFIQGFPKCGPLHRGFLEALGYTSALIQVLLNLVLFHEVRF